MINRIKRHLLRMSLEEEGYTNFDDSLYVNFDKGKGRYYEIEGIDFYRFANEKAKDIMVVRYEDISIIRLLKRLGGMDNK